MSSKNTFASLGINNSIMEVLSSLGYEKPTPIQEASIPALLNGDDVLAQAQTGTGKTAAFALPILTKMELEPIFLQALILVPTRELAIQVAESFQHYAKGMKNFHVLPIYGGHDYSSQLKALKRGVHVVVGTPGRVMDHMGRKTLVIDNIKTLILDEADKMLDMGFQEDVEWILAHIKSNHQTALFSATLPPAIQKVSSQYLRNPRVIKTQAHETTVDTIEQWYLLVENHHKLEALTRFLELEEFEAVLIFTRTKLETEALAEKLAARGYAAAAMNGDMNQNAREKTIARLKQKTLDIIVATEVAARGLDIQRLTHVINYDIPYDAEAYVHRIGRTGRAGRQGKALLFVAPRERRMLHEIERITRKKIAALALPSISDINKKRTDAFAKKVLQVIATKNLQLSRILVEKIVHDSEYAEHDIAAALAYMAQEQKPLKEDKVDPLLITSFSEGSEGDVKRKKRVSRSDSSRKKFDNSPKFGKQRKKSSDKEGAFKKRKRPESKSIGKKKS